MPNWTKILYYFRNPSRYNEKQQNMPVKRIAIINDNQEFIETLSEILTLDGYKVEGCSYGRSQILGIEQSNRHI